MPHNYPQEAVLRDGRRVLIRPFAHRPTPMPSTSSFTASPADTADSPGTRSKTAT